MARPYGKKRARERQGGGTSPALENDSEKLLRECKSEFLADLRHDRKWRKEKSEDEDFYDGDQWTEDEKKVLEERHQAPIVVNRVKPKVDAISGMQMEIPVDTKPFPKGIMDFEKAKHMGVVIRHVEQTNDFDSHENDAFEDMLKGGRGWYKTWIEWEDFEPMIRTNWLDNDDVVPDRHSKKPDLSDAKRVSETLWMDLSDAKKLFPEAKEELSKCFVTKNSLGEELEGGRRRRPDQYQNSPNEEDSDEASDYQEFVDSTRKRIRIVTSQYRESYYQKILVAPGMRAVDVTKGNRKEVEAFLSEFPEAEEFTQLRHRLHQVTFCWTAVLEEKRDLNYGPDGEPWDKSAQFWYTKCQGYRRKKDGVDYGIIRQMKDPQREHNKRRSKAIHLFSTNQIIREPNAVQDPEIARIEANKPDGDIVVNPGMRFEMNRNIDMGTAHFQMLQESKSELESTGVPRELEGISNASSGREFQLKQRSQIAGIRRLFRNLRNARRQVGVLWIKMIQHYYTSQMVLKVSDDPQAPVFVLNQPAVDETGAPVLDPATGEQAVLNDLSAGDYDLIVEESTEYINLESETFAQLSALAMKGFPIPPEMLISVAPVPNRQEWLQKIQAQQAAQEAALVEAQALQAAQAQGQGGSTPIAA